mmetsp:Transcript_23197/g.30964  ORF Transcript_23197/g.30964 Transcript_23197/m.30964 type:complete len:92 (+) Transcript_23197:528-803(+)
MQGTEANAPAAAAAVAAPDENQVNGARATGKKDGIPYFSYDNNKSEGATGAVDGRQNHAAQGAGAEFKMLDGAGADEAPLQMINTMGDSRP